MSEVRKSDNHVEEQRWSFFLLLFNQYLLTINYVAGTTIGLGNAELHWTGVQPGKMSLKSAEHGPGGWAGPVH